MPKPEEKPPRVFPLGPVVVPTGSDDVETRSFAMFCAAIYFGLSCASPNAIPPKIETVVKGAREIHTFITGQ